MPDRLFQELDHYRNQLNNLMNNPQKDLEGWYISVEYCTQRIGNLTLLIATRRIGLFS